MKLHELSIRGFKSIDRDKGITINFGDVTVLIGANGSGKSNIISFFKMLNYMTTSALDQYVGKYGVSRLLFYGPQNTDSIIFDLTFKNDADTDIYHARLAYGLPDRLFISGERVTYQRHDREQPFEKTFANTGTIPLISKDTNKTSRIIYSLLSKIRAYQFHDTSDTAKIKDRGYVDDAKYLRHDAGNLAAFLKMLKENESYKRYYERILHHIKKVTPQFGDFDLQSIPGNKDYVRLNWKDSSDTEYLFDPYQLSDGTLRFIALTTLLLQPPQLLPSLIVLDEPELGLHPNAISELAGMIRMTSQYAQVLLATQSTRLVDEFDPEEIVIVERDKERKSTVLRQLDPEGLHDWLSEYSISELWEKNVIGGQP